MVNEGDAFPDFRLPDQDGTERTLSDLAGDSGLILYVYPKDNTPGCTTEANDFGARQEAFREQGYEIVGLSKDGAASHQRFIAKHEIPFPLLSDEDTGFMQTIGAFGEKKMYGKVTQGVIRSTFVIERDGTLRRALRNVRAKGHAERVLREIGA
ncbi:MAG: peroxiredoxin [Acidobacteriota bacterium]